MKHDRPSIAVTDLSAWYENSGRQVAVFWAVNLRVRPGEIIGVLGPNGCGKSTLLRSISNLHRHATGKIELHSRDDSEPRMSILPQAFANSFFNWASLCFNIGLAARGKAMSGQSIVEYIDYIKHELELDLSLRPTQCSGGMIQQAGLIRSLANDPDILIVDEPFSALDIDITRRVCGKFREHVKKKKIAVLAVMHDIEDLAGTCDRILVIPGRPFSSKRIEDYDLTEIISNEMIAGRESAEHKEQAIAKLSFVNMLKSVMQARDNQLLDASE